MDRFADLAKALSDPARLRILKLLEGRELCVCQIHPVLGGPASGLSRNLSILKSAGLVAARREGRWIHYRLDFDGADASARQFLGVAAASLNGDKQIRRDRAALKRLLKLSREELCRRGAEAA